MTDPESIPIRPEIDAFLKEHRRTFFITIRKDGTPTIHPMTGLYDEGRLRYSSYKTSAKNRNIERDDRVCSLVLNGYDVEPMQAVTLKGVTRILEGTEMPRRQGPAPAASNESGARRAQAAIQTGRRAIVEIVPSDLAAFIDQARGG